MTLAKNMTAQKPMQMPTPKDGLRPWWKEPYVWLVISGPVSVIIACGITAAYILQGPDAVVPEDSYQAGLEIKKQVQSAQPPMQPAQMGRNHSATGGQLDAKP